MDDRKRIPYNTWLIFYSIIVLLLISGIGVVIIYIASTADINVETEVFYRIESSYGMNLNALLRRLVPTCKQNTNCNLTNVEIQYTERHCSYCGTCSDVKKDLYRIEEEFFTSDEENTQFLILKFIGILVGGLFIVIGFGFLENHLSKHYWHKEKKEVVKKPIKINNLIAEK